MAAATKMKKVSHLRLPPLPTIRDIIRLYRLRALKELSQNFLMEPRLTDKIVKAAGCLAGAQVCEVGPGPGNITRPIISRGARRVFVIEKDPRFLPALELLEDAVKNVCKVEIAVDDVMDFDLSKVFDSIDAKPWEDNTPNIHLIGNLPFSVSTPLIVRWLHSISLKNNAWVHGRVPMTLTFQKEVAERMAAPILSKQRCRLSVMTQNWCTVKHAFDIPGRAFLPKPEVDVGVVHLVPRVNPIIPLEFKLVEKVLRTIFNFRRKYCVKSVERLFPIQQREELSREMFILADLNPEIRPFQITNQEFGRLCKAYKTICDKEPRLYMYDHRAALTDKNKRWDECVEEEIDEVESEET